MMGCPIFSAKWNKSGSHILVSGDNSRLDVIREQLNIRFGKLQIGMECK
jgi:hypothetical protein